MSETETYLAPGGYAIWSALHSATLRALRDNVRLSRTLTEAVRRERADLDLIRAMADLVGAERLVMIPTHPWLMFDAEYLRTAWEREVRRGLRRCEIVVADPWLLSLSLKHAGDILSKAEVKLVPVWKRLKMRVSGEYALHEPCSLVRWHDVRNSLVSWVSSNVEVRTPALMSGKFSPCCGYPTALLRPEIALSACEQVLSMMTTLTSRILTVCPYCHAMFSAVAEVRSLDVEVRDAIYSSVSR